MNALMVLIFIFFIVTNYLMYFVPIIFFLFTINYKNIYFARVNKNNVYFTNNFFLSVIRQLIFIITDDLQNYNNCFQQL